MTISIAERSGKQIVIDEMPGRKKLCLAIIDGNTETKVASFNNDDAALLFLTTLSEISGRAINSAVFDWYWRREEK